MLFRLFSFRRSLSILLLFSWTFWSFFPVLFRLFRSQSQAIQSPPQLLNLSVILTTFPITIYVLSPIINHSRMYYRPSPTEFQYFCSRSVALFISFIRSLFSHFQLISHCLFRLFSNLYSMLCQGCPSINQ